MKNVLLAILSSHEELYINNTAALIAGYKKMIETFQLEVNFDVIYYTSGPKTERVDNVLYIDCDDNDLITKQWALFEYVFQHPEYDILIKTNNSICLNLNILNFFIKKYFDPNIIYGENFITYNLPFYYVRGSFNMVSTEYLRKNIGSTEQYNKLKDELYTIVNDCRYTDDTLMGLLIYKTHTTMGAICGTSIRQIDILMKRYSTGKYNIHRSLFVNVSYSGSGIPKEYRAMVEPNMINIVMDYMIHYKLDVSDFSSIYVVYFTNTKTD